MKLLTTVLIVIFLTTTIAKPTLRHWHHDADIADSAIRQGWRWDWRDIFWQSSESSNYKDSSSESSESSESRDSSDSRSSEESSEEIIDQTAGPVATAAFTTPATITPAMTTFTMEEGSAQTSDPVTVDTDEPIVTETPDPVTVGTDEPIVTETTPTVTNGDVTHCVTVDIATLPPITNNRGDN